jgi:hypothetical protein
VYDLPFVPTRPEVEKVRLVGLNITKERERVISSWRLVLRQIFAAPSPPFAQNLSSSFMLFHSTEA